MNTKYMEKCELAEEYLKILEYRGLSFVSERTENLKIILDGSKNRAPTTRELLVNLLEACEEFYTKAHRKPKRKFNVDAFLSF